MRKILALSLKDTLLRFSSPVEWLFFLVMPLFFIYMISGGTNPDQDQRIHLYVVDQAQGELSSALIAELEKSPAVKPIPKALEEALEAFDARQVSAVLIIPTGFDTQALKDGQAELELKQQPNAVNALIDQQAVQTAIGRLSSLTDIANASTTQAAALMPFENEGARQAYFDEAFSQAQVLMAASPSRVREVQAITADPIEYDPRANTVAGQMITWTFIPLIGLSAMFAMERASGTLRRLLVTPTSKAQILGGTIFGQVVTAVLQMAILVTFGALVLKIDWGQSPLGLLMVIVPSTLAAAALGTMLGTFVKSEGQANGLSIMIGMVMAMLSGCWYPIELFPPFMRTAAQIFPTYWSMQGFLDIAVRGQGAAGVALESLVLLGFAAVFFVVGVLRFRFE